MENNIIWIIFGLVIFLALLFFGYTFTKDRRTKRKIKENDFKIKIISETKQQEIIISISNIIENNEKILENFQPSIGKFKMSDINNIAKELLLKIIKEDDYRKFIKNQKEMSDFDANVDKLFKTRANTWNKSCVAQIEFFEAKRKEIEFNDVLINFDEQNKKEINEAYSNDKIYQIG